MNEMQEVDLKNQLKAAAWQMWVIEQQWKQEVHYAHRLAVLTMYTNRFPPTSRVSYI